MTTIEKAIDKRRSCPCYVDAEKCDSCKAITSAIAHHNVQTWLNCFVTMQEDSIVMQQRIEKEIDEILFRIHSYEENMAHFAIPSAVQELKDQRRNLAKEIKEHDEAEMKEMMLRNEIKSISIQGPAALEQWIIEHGAFYG